MKKLLLVAVAALVVAAPAMAAAPTKKQPVTPGFFRGKAVGYYNFGPTKLKPDNTLAPIWTVTNGVDGQHNVIDSVPGQPDYSPLWQVEKVTFKDGVTPRLLTSKAAIVAAEQAGDVTIEKTSTVVNCPVLGDGQNRVPGFSGGRLIHYYDLGPVQVAPGNAVVPLYTVTNPVGVAQRNIAGDTLAPGQTAYPPLWGISKVTFKPGVKPYLITSYAQIEQARAAGKVTVERTSLVVNCPVVS